jgi:hypothetical protein
MKILFSSSRDIEKPINKLSKIEIISLINLLNKLSESINYYDKFLDEEKDRAFLIQMGKHLICYVGIVSIFSIIKFIEL